MSYDLLDLSINRSFEFYVLTQNFKILKFQNLKLWLLEVESVENFFEWGLHFFKYQSRSLSN